MNRKKNDTGREEWLKVMARLEFALAVAAVAGNVPSAPAQQPATSCVTLRALSLAGPAA